MKQRRMSEQRQLVVQAIESTYCEQQATLGELRTFATRIVESIVVSVQTPDGLPSNGKEMRDRARDHLLAELKLPTFEQIVDPYPPTTGKESPLTLLANARGWTWMDDLAIARSFRQQILDRGVEISMFGLMRIQKDLQTAKFCAFRRLVSDASRPTSIVWQADDSSRISCDRVRHEAQLEDVTVYPYESIGHARGVNVPIRISRLINSAPDCLRPVLELVAGTVVAERFVRYAAEDVPWTRTQNVDPAVTLFRNYVVTSNTDLDEPEFSKETGNG